MRVITIEEHWTTPGLDRALRAQPLPFRDESVALNDRGDLPARLLDVGEQRIAAMDAAGVDVQVLSLAPPGTHGLPPREAVALSREANDLASEAVGRHPARLRAMTTLPMSDPDAAVTELERTAGSAAHVGIMSYGRSGDRPLDDPAYDALLGTAAALGRPVFLHPQIPPNAVRDASYRGFDPTVELALATFGWGWHLEAGLAALRLILRGTFDRHPDLQIVLGHWGEMLLFALDRVDSLSHVATHLDRRVADYFRTNVHLATSGMLTPRLLRHALDFTSVDRILLSGDYPFHRFDAATLTAFLGTLADPEDRHKIAHANAEALYRLESPSPGAHDGPAHLFERP
ncbi:amidohydrolase family protein [Streptomyces lunalinharesii]|uniref:Amidohydrolase family protein n=1 Tax=Streptomyces lunalinharesii TaxID=333384 RepID=A0ABN3R5N4_9ACTN